MIFAKFKFPDASNISIERVSPNETQVVLGEAVSMVSIVRNSVGQQKPLERSSFEIVPEAIMLPKLSGMGVVTCTIS